MAHVVAVTVAKRGDQFDFERVWTKQGGSTELVAQIAALECELKDIPRRTECGRMVSESVKLPEYRGAVLGATYSATAKKSPEVR